MSCINGSVGYWVRGHGELRQKRVVPSVRKKNSWSRE